MRFNPLVQRVVDLVEQGELGEIRSLSAAFGFHAPYDPAGRMWAPELGGGALLAAWRSAAEGQGRDGSALAALAALEGLAEQVLDAGETVLQAVAVDHDLGALAVAVVIVAVALVAAVAVMAPLGGGRRGRRLDTGHRGLRAHALARGRRHVLLLGEGGGGGEQGGGGDGEELLHGCVLVSVAVPSDGREGFSFTAPPFSGWDMSRTHARESRD